MVATSETELSDELSRSVAANPALDVGSLISSSRQRAKEWCECACTLPAEHSRTLSNDERASCPSTPLW
jgi:hypothetical protein